MKRTLLLIFLIISMISSHLIQTRIGCLSASKHLSEPFDTKAYHPVQCNCNCAYHEAKGMYSPAQNQCLECGHSHDPQPLFIVKKSIKTAINNHYTIREASDALQLLINAYRHKKALSYFDK